MTHQEQAERFSQYYKALDELNRNYLHKLGIISSLLPVRYKVEKDTITRIVSNEYQLILDEMVFHQEMLKKQFHIVTEYGD